MVDASWICTKAMLNLKCACSGAIARAWVC